MSITLELQGFDEVIELLEGVNVPGQLGEVVEGTIVAGARFAAVITPVDTAAMQQAWTAQAQGLDGRVFVDPSAVNPRSGVAVTSYAPDVDERAGIMDKAFTFMSRIGTRMLERVDWEAR